MPALNKIENVEYVGIAVAKEEEWFNSISNYNDLSILNAEKIKAEKFKEKYGGIIFQSYDELLNSDKVNAVYIPLPPALHYKWAKQALLCRKHVFIEKPSTTSFEDTNDLVNIAKEHSLAIQENYMFIFHSQIHFIQQLLENKAVGEVYLYRISFGFPFRGLNDFRYNKALGGGSLLDCGGYTIRLARLLLGDECKLVSHNLHYGNKTNVDIFGTATIENKNGVVAQLAFGMDNYYKCDLEIRGSTGTIFTNRILTAPDGFNPKIVVRTNEEEKLYDIDSDDSFMKSIQNFINCILDENVRNEMYLELINQETFIEKFKEKK